MPINFGFIRDCLNQKIMIVEITGVSGVGKSFLLSSFYFKNALSCDHKILSRSQHNSIRGFSMDFLFFFAFFLLNRQDLILLRHTFGVLFLGKHSLKSFINILRNIYLRLVKFRFYSLSRSNFIFDEGTFHILVSIFSNCNRDFIDEHIPKIFDLIPIPDRIVILTDEYLLCQQRFKLKNYKNPHWRFNDRNFNYEILYNSNLYVLNYINVNCPNAYTINLSDPSHLNKLNSILCFK